MRCRAALLGLLAAVALAGTAAAKVTPFTPKTLAGTWSGSWTNETFGSTGPAKIIVKSLATNTKLLFTVDFGGNVFGCEDPGPEATKPLLKGKGANHWNAAGFVIAGTSQAFGTIKLVYVQRTHGLTGGGQNPTCRVGLTWKVTGTFSAKTFAGTVAIVLPDGSPATSKIALTRG